MYLYEGAKLTTLFLNFSKLFSKSDIIQSLAAWTAICNKSRLEFQQIYDLLKVNLTERGESFYNPLLPGLVRRLKESGVVQTSEGAECIFVEGFKNSDGSPLPLVRTVRLHSAIYFIWFIKDISNLK